MLFNSYEFVLVFLPLTLVGYFALGRHSPWAARTWLTAQSMVFYGWWDWRFLLLLLVSIVGNFLAGVAIGHLNAAGRAHAARWLTVVAIAGNLGLLGVFKYTDFVIGALHAAGLNHIPFQEIVLPLGISFFTFTQIAYQVDVFKGYAPERRIVTYALFVSFFPQFIAGPILHHQEMMPQFDRRRAYLPHWEAMATGLAVFALGLSKKVLIADELGPFATFVFNSAGNGVPLTIFEAWGGALAYTLQIYFDFSAYSDMAIGLGAMFGIRLPINFLSPYKARSIIEFWRRWHITLSRFLRGYLYIPLGGNRRGRPRRWVNLMVTMLLGGMWHGAGLTFIVWGGLHGLLLMINHAWVEIAGRLGARWGRRPTLGVWPARAVTFLAVVVTWVFFRAESFGEATTLLSAMAGRQIVSLPASLSGYAAALSWLPIDGLRFDGMFLNFYGKINWIYGTGLIAAAMVLAFAAPNLPQMFGRRFPALPNADAAAMRSFALPRPAVVALVTAAILNTCLLAMGKVSEFLYFQF